MHHSSPDRQPMTGRSGEAVGAERGPQLANPLAQMGHELKHGGSQTLVDEVAGQSALTGHKHSAKVILAEMNPRYRLHRQSLTDVNIGSDCCQAANVSMLADSTSTSIVLNVVSPY